MKDYASMSDFELNQMVSAYLWGSICAVDGVVLHNERDGEFDPCNNPADAWPIIVQSGISLIKCTVGSGCWSSEIITDIDETTDKLFQCQSSFDYQDANPLRAAMIVFLMMKENEND